MVKINKILHKSQWYGAVDENIIKSYIVPVRVVIP